MQNKLFFLVIFIASLSLLSGCASGSRFFLKKAYKPHGHPALLNEYQARFDDIPFPFDGEILNETLDKELEKGLVFPYNHEQNYSEQDYSDDTKAQFFQNYSVQNNSVFVITCLTDLSLSELRTLYHTEMEQLGWRERAFFQDDHFGKEKFDTFGFTFIFEKPGNKLCIISVKTFNKKYIIRYYRA